MVINVKYKKSSVHMFDVNTTKLSSSFHLFDISHKLSSMDKEIKNNYQSGVDDCT